MSNEGFSIRPSQKKLDQPRRVRHGIKFRRKNGLDALPWHADAFLRAVEEGACLLGFGPGFPTQSKVLASPVVGLSRLSEVARAVPLPIVAIGGIDASQFKTVLSCGVGSIAVVRAIVGAEEPEQAVKSLMSHF